MNLRESLRSCCEQVSLSGCEDVIQTEKAAEVSCGNTKDTLAYYLCERLGKIGISTYIDRAGNVRGLIKSVHKNTGTVMLEAHRDQIGLMVSGVDDNGLVKFDNLGGVDERILCGMEVEILSDDTEICGIISAVLPKENKDKKMINAGINELRIDIGMEKTAAERAVKIGDCVVMKSEFTELFGDKISSAAMDNRAGVTAILDCAEKAVKLELPYNVEIVFSAQEELGLHGAFGIENSRADVAIVVDVTHGLTSDSKKETGVFPLGCGAVICRGPNLHYEYTKQLIGAAKENGIPYEIEVASGASGTTAWAIQVLSGGIAALLVSVPLRYMHTNVETVSLSDIGAVSDLLLAAITGGIKLDI